MNLVDDLSVLRECRAARAPLWQTQLNRMQIAQNHSCGLNPVPSDGHRSAGHTLSVCFGTSCQKSSARTPSTAVIQTFNTCHSSCNLLCLSIRLATVDCDYICQPLTGQEMQQSRLYTPYDIRGQVALVTGIKIGFLLATSCLGGAGTDPSLTSCTCILHNRRKLRHRPSNCPTAGRGGM